MDKYCGDMELFKPLEKLPNVQIGTVCICFQIENKDPEHPFKLHGLVQSMFCQEIGPSPLTSDNPEPDSRFYLSPQTSEDQQFDIWPQP